MRVLIVIGQYSPIKGGAEGQAKKQAEELVRQGHKVDVLTYSRRGLKRTETINGVKIFRLKGLLFKKIKLYSLIFSAIGYILFNRNKYDVVHAHMAMIPAFSSVVAGRLFRIPTVVKVASSGDNFDLTKLANNFVFGQFMADFLIKHTDCFVAIAPNVLKQLIDCGVDDCRVKLVPNGVEQQVLHNYDKRCPTKIIVISRLIELKNLFFLVDVIKNLNSKVCLNIYGDGPLRSQLEAYVKEVGLEDVINFHGETDKHIIETALSNSGLFLLPSLVEGLSNALLESMSFGVVPIVSDIPGNSFVVSGNLSDLVLPFDVDVWSNKIDSLIESEEQLLHFRTLTQERIKKFYIAEVVERCCYLYESLSNNK